MTSFDQYYYMKFCQCLLCNKTLYDRLLKGDFDSYIFNNVFLEIFFELITTFIDNNILKNKGWAYNIILYFRANGIYFDEISKLYYEQRFKELIIKLNGYGYKENDNFYTTEIVKRFSYFDSKVNYRNFEQQKQFVERTLKFDFLILTYFTEIIDEQTFEDKINELVMNEYCFASLNAIISEYPEILKDETFKRRIKKLLDLNKKNLYLLQGKKITDKIYLLKNNLKYSLLCI